MHLGRYPNLSPWRPSYLVINLLVQVQMGGRCLFPFTFIEGACDITVFIYGLRIFSRSHLFINIGKRLIFYGLI